MLTLPLLHLYNTFCREICEQLLHMLQPDKKCNRNGPRKVLDAPIHLASMTTNVNETDDLKSIWLHTRDDNLVCICEQLDIAFNSDVLMYFKKC